MNRDTIWQIIRYVLLFVGGATTVAGYMSEEEVKLIVGAVGTLFTTGWGVWVKWRTSPVLDKVIVEEQILSVDSATGTAVKPSTIAKAAAVVLLAAVTLAVSISPSDAGRRHRSDGDFWGGFVGGLLAGPPRYRERERYAPEMPFDPVADCARRFRSYDPSTGFYRGYDGYLRRCP